MKKDLPPPRNRMLPFLRKMKKWKAYPIQTSDMMSLYRAARKEGMKLVGRGWGSETMKVWRVK